MAKHEKRGERGSRREREREETRRYVKKWLAIGIPVTVVGIVVASILYWLYWHAWYATL